MRPPLPTEEHLIPLVQLYVKRVLAQRPTPLHLIAQAHLAHLEAEGWVRAVQRLHEVLMGLDGRSSQRWGLTRQQGSRFCQWRRNRLEHMSA